MVISHLSWGTLFSRVLMRSVLYVVFSHEIMMAFHAPKVITDDPGHTAETDK